MSKERSIFHLHRYTPIVSMYWTFSTRKIIYECQCGKREVRQVYRNFGDEFPIDTAIMLSNTDFNAILNGEEYEYLSEHMVILKKYLIKD